MKIRLLVALLGGALLAASAHAQPFLLAGNIGDGSGISPGMGATFTGNPSPFPFTSRQAIPFTLASTAQLGAVQVTISNLTGGGGVNVTLAPDAAGAPNDSLGTLLGTIDTAVTLGSGYEALFVPLTSFPQLDAGQTYWIVLSAAPNSVYAWNAASSGPVGFFNPDETGWSPNTFSYGFAVFAVPEPTTIAGGLLAAALLLARLRRHRPPAAA